MLNFEQGAGHFPSGGWGYNWVGDPDRGTGLEQPGGWLFSILPHLEQEALYNLGSDGNADAWTATQLAGMAQAIQTPLAAMNCPSRRQAVAYPVGWSGAPGFSGNFHTPYGANQVSTCARGDYAACAGSQEIPWDMAGPASLRAARTLPQNNTWPKLEKVGGGSGSYAYRSDPATGICYLRSAVTMGQITDGTSSTYMLGEKYLIPDHYYDGADGNDNETMYCGYDGDIHRTTFDNPSSGPPHTPATRSAPPAQPASPPRSSGTAAATSRCPPGPAA